MSDLYELTKQWMTSMQDMLVLLDQEFTALKEKNIEHIEAFSQQKIQLVALLSEQELALLRQAQGFTGQELASFLSYACHNTIKAETIRRLAQDLRQANQRNGMLLQAMIRLNEYGLNILTGKQASQSTYGASGQISNSSQLTKLATA